MSLGKFIDISLWNSLESMFRKFWLQWCESAFFGGTLSAATRGPGTADYVGPHTWLHGTLGGLVWCLFNVYLRTNVPVRTTDQCNTPKCKKQWHSGASPAFKPAGFNSHTARLLPLRAGLPSLATWLCSGVAIHCLPLTIFRTSHKVFLPPVSPLSFHPIICRPS